MPSIDRLLRFEEATFGRLMRLRNLKKLLGAVAVIETAGLIAGGVQKYRAYRQNHIAELALPVEVPTVLVPPPATTAGDVSQTIAAQVVEPLSAEPFTQPAEENHDR